MKTRTYGNAFDTTNFSVAPVEEPCGDRQVAMWVAHSGCYTTHMSTAEARAMGKRLIKIANKIEKDALK